SDTYSAVRCSFVGAAKQGGMSSGLEAAKELVDVVIKRTGGLGSRMSGTPALSGSSAQKSSLSTSQQLLNGAHLSLAVLLDKYGMSADACDEYEKAGRYSRAVLCAAKAGLVGKCLSILQTNSSICDRVAFEAASILEGMDGGCEAAVNVYMERDYHGRALSICFEHNMRDSLNRLVERIISQQETEEGRLVIQTIEKDVLAKASEFLMTKGDVERSAGLLCAGGHHVRALKLVVEKNVKVTERLIELLTPPPIPKLDKTKKASSIDQKKLAMTPEEREEAVKERNEILIKLGKLAKRSQLFNTASKKYTQGGELVKAVKSLILGGNVKKVLFFAKTSKNRDVLIATANFLQTLDWRKDKLLLKSITTFYKKAKAFDHLYRFFESCADQEIDEFRNYEKAADALREAKKYLQQTIDRLQISKGGADVEAGLKKKEDAMGVLSLRIKFIGEFCELRTLAKSNPVALPSACESLLSKPNVDQALRIGDIYGLMVEFYYYRNEFSAAHQKMKEMVSKEIQLGYYVDEKMIEKVCEEVGEPLEEKEEEGSFESEEIEDEEFSDM
ncbi:hypothetical protein ADUPG1_007803, partial [Aduncisulcus paluster]